MITCTLCNQELPASEFYYNKAKKKYYTKCKACHRQKYDRNMNLTGGVSFRKALPPHKWEDMQHFLAALRICADAADKSKVTPDVSNFLEKYREISAQAFL